MISLHRRLRACGVPPGEVREIFSRSQGPGGQNVNKVETCVHLVHEASGLSAKAADSRHRETNRRIAWQRLVEAAEARLLKQEQARRALAAKKRRQLAQRAPATKAKMVLEKRHRAEIRAARRFQSADD